MGPAGSDPTKLLLQKLEGNRVEMLGGWRVERIEDTGVVVENTEHETERFLEAEQVVFAMGWRPEDSLFEPIASLGYEVHKIGDCLEPRSAKAAIYEGAVLGRSI